MKTSGFRLWFLILLLCVPFGSFRTPVRADDAPGKASQASPASPQAPAQPDTAEDPAAGKPRAGWSFREMRAVPIQSGGRIKPLDSFAREDVLFITGFQSFEGWEPIDLLFSWLAYPLYWQHHPFIRINRVDVRRQLGIDENRAYFTPGELFGNFSLLQYAREMESRGMGTAEALTGKTDRGNKETPREQELRSVFQRLGLFREIVGGTVWTVVPQPGDQAWKSLADNAKESEAIRARFFAVVRAYLAQDQTQFDRESTLARAAIQGEISGWTDHESRQIGAEVFYNRVHPFQEAWILYLAGALLWLIAPKAAGAPKSWRARFAGWAVAGAFAFHTLGIGLRCYIAGRPPVTNMYESIIWVSYGTVLFASILLWIQKNPVTLMVASALSTVGLIVADSAPAMIDPGLHPLMPVLRSNYWLTIHVLTITLSYSAFALTLGLANVTLWNYFKQDRARAVGDQAAVTAAQQRISGLNLLTYRAMQFGIVLVAAGTILGGVWADYSWGRFWGWDPKEVWALVVTLTYVAIVHGRMTNWITPFAFAVVSVMGFLSVLMAWYGVNFILGVGLHSYGFSTGGTAYVAGFTGCQLLYVGAIAAHRYTSSRDRGNGPGTTPLPAQGA